MDSGKLPSDEGNRKAEINDLSAVGELVLLPGEQLANEVRTKSLEVWYLYQLLGESTPLPIKGEIRITNFRLWFKSRDEQYPLTLNVPLMTIASISKPGGASSRGEYDYQLQFVCKDMRTLTFAFSNKAEHSRSIVYEAVQSVAFAGNSKLFSFEYYRALQPNRDGAQLDRGWSVYDPEKEYARQGIPNDFWRPSEINKNFQFCDTYPTLLYVPRQAADSILSELTKYRSRHRVPVLSWLHPTNGASITRGAQPLTGATNAVSHFDIRYLQYVLETNSQSNKLFIFDARPFVNALANRARGGGFETEEQYCVDLGGGARSPSSPSAAGSGALQLEVSFLDIENIHRVRDSFQRLRSLCYPLTSDESWLRDLERTGWLKHIKTILTGALRIAEKVENQRSSVFVHCSDGWDRTAQLTSLAMLLLDSYYRTIVGFEVLIEKEWISYGHKFQSRIGHGESKPSSEYAPIFVQFIDCVWQVLNQVPNAFEFNEQLLITILDHLYSCQYGTFLCDSEKERYEKEIRKSTSSLWTYINANLEEFTNPDYSDMLVNRVIFPNSSLRRLRLWQGYYLRAHAQLQPQEPIIARNKELLRMRAALGQKVEESVKSAKERVTTRSPTHAAASGGERHSSGTHAPKASPDSEA